MLNKPKIIAIVGPTSGGKTGVAVEIARKIGGEIISTDSRQIYRGLDIGSGKVTKKEMRGVRHHLLDVASSQRTLSVAQYKKLADRAVRDVMKRGKLPILCGGTGLYVDAILNDQTFPEVPPNLSLRKTLTKFSTAQLFEKLKKLDPVRAANIDNKNPHRLIRAIEIATALGSVPALAPAASKYDALIIGLNLPREELQQRVHTRLIARLRKGMIAEAKHLHENRLSWKRMEALGLDYRYLAQFLQNKISKEQMMYAIEHESWLYAKRQMVWFKRNKSIHWFRYDEPDKILTTVQGFIKR